eukprot:470767_1
MADLASRCKDCDCPRFQSCASPFHQGICNNQSCKHPKGSHEKKEPDEVKESKEDELPVPAKRLRSQTLDSFQCIKKARALGRTGHSRDYEGHAHPKGSHEKKEPDEVKESKEDELPVP